MPWKLILFLLCLIATTFFVGFNLENACNINLVFKTYENVPVFLTVLISFASGVIIAFLFSVGMRISGSEKKVKQVKEKKQPKSELKETIPTSTNEKQKKVSMFSKLKNKDVKSAAEDSPLVKEEQVISLDDSSGVK